MVALKDRLLGQRQVDPGAINTIQAHDRARELPLKRALIIDLLRKIRQPHIGFVEQLKSHSPF